MSRQQLIDEACRRVIFYYPFSCRAALEGSQLAKSFIVETAIEEWRRIEELLP